MADFTTRTLRRPSAPVHGTLFVPVSARYPAAVLLIGGSGGSEPSYAGQALAGEGIAAMSVAYFTRPGLPGRLRGIRLEYFFSALEILRDELPSPTSPIVVLGMSRGSEAAMLTAIHWPVPVRAVVATVPGNLVAGSLPPGGPAWLLDGQPLPYAVHAGPGLRERRCLHPRRAGSRTSPAHRRRSKPGLAFGRHGKSTITAPARARRPARPHGPGIPKGQPLPRLSHPAPARRAAAAGHHRRSRGQGGTRGRMAQDRHVHPATRNTQVTGRVRPAGRLSPTPPAGPESMTKPPPTPQRANFDDEAQASRLTTNKARPGQHPTGPRCMSPDSTARHRCQPSEKTRPVTSGPSSIRRALRDR